MSGGSMDYIYNRLQEQFGCFKGDYQEDYLQSLLEDFTYLLHAREWFLSGDYSEGEWNETRDNFLLKYKNSYQRPIYCCDCEFWNKEKNSSYGSCKLIKTRLFHRCNSVCSNVSLSTER